MRTYPAAANLPYSVELGVGDHYFDANFGFRDPCDVSIGDFVYSDLDSDGAHDAGEPGISGIKVKLSPDGVLVAVTTTNSTGYYSFTGLCEGDYSVDVTPGGGTVTSSTPCDRTLTIADDTKTDCDFGFGPGSIGDLIWLDVDDDGIKHSSENGIQSVTVKLFKQGNTTPLGSDTTDASGNYDFQDLPPGTYLVKVEYSTVSPTGLVLTTESGTLTVALGVSEDYTAADFGYKDPGAGRIGGRVYFDAATEDFGVHGVTVKLHLGGVEIADGLYEFTGLGKGWQTTWSF